MPSQLPDLRLLFVLDSVFPITKGGSEMRVDRIARYCQDHGCKVDILCGKWWSGPAKHGFLTGLPVLGSLKKGKLGFLEAASFAASFAATLPRLETEYDVVEFSQTPVMHLGLVDFARRSQLGRSARFLCHVNEVWPAGYWLRYAGAAGGVMGFGLENYSFRRFNHLITISEFNRKRLLKRGARPGSVSVIRPGVDFGAVSSAVASGSYDVIFVGRLVREKGVMLLVDVVPPLEKELGRKVRVAVAGAGPEAEEMKRKALGAGVGESVSFLGRVETQGELYSLLKSSKVFVYPAAPEGGWSLAMVEANAAAVPTVSCAASEIGTAREVIDEGVNGVIVPSLNAEMFAVTLAGLLRDEARLSNLSKSSIESARRYDWGVVGAETLDLYRRIAAEGVEREQESGTK